MGWCSEAAGVLDWCPGAGGVVRSDDHGLLLSTIDAEGPHDVLRWPHPEKPARVVADLDRPGTRIQSASRAPEVHRNRHDPLRATPNCPSASRHRSRPVPRRSSGVPPARAGGGSDEPPRTTQIRRHQRFAGPGHPARDAGTGTAHGYVAKVRRRHTRLGVLEIIAITMGLVAAVYTAWVIQDVSTARQEEPFDLAEPHPSQPMSSRPGGSAGGAHESSTPRPLPCSRDPSPHDPGDRRLDRRRLGIVGRPGG